MATLVLVVGASAAAYLVNRYSPTSTVTTTVTPPPPKATWALTLPVTVGAYSRNAAVDATPVTGADGKQTISASYAKGGAPAAVVVMSRPYTDLAAFMTAANINAVTPDGDALCGISGDSKNLEACAIQADDTAILVVASGDITRADMLQLARQIETQVKG